MRDLQGFVLISCTATPPPTRVRVESGSCQVVIAGRAPRKGPLGRISVANAGHLGAGGRTEREGVAAQGIGGVVLVAAAEAEDPGSRGVEVHREVPPAGTDWGLLRPDRDHPPLLAGEWWGVRSAREESDRGKSQQAAHHEGTKSTEGDLRGLRVFVVLRCSHQFAGPRRACR